MSNISPIQNDEDGEDVRLKLNTLVAGANNTPRQRFRGGRWYPAFPASIASGTALSANSLRLIPFYVHEGITISDLGNRVSILAASSNFQLSIYGSGSDDLAQGEVLANTGNLSGAVQAWVSGPIVQGNVYLPPALYWAGVNADGPVGLQMINASVPWTQLILGSATGVNLGGGNTSRAMVYAIAATFGTYPNLTTTPAIEIPNNSQASIIDLKIVSAP